MSDEAPQPARGRIAPSEPKFPEKGAEREWRTCAQAPGSTKTEACARARVPEPDPEDVRVRGHRGEEPAGLRTEEKEGRVGAACRLRRWRGGCAPGQRRTQGRGRRAARAGAGLPGCAGARAAPWPPGVAVAAATAWSPSI